MTDSDIAHIRAWFERHRNDHCTCLNGPPGAWIEFFELLLIHAEKDSNDESAPLPVDDQP